MRKFFALLSFAAFMFTGISVSINAATDATVNATVTPQNISITVSDGVVSYGNQALSGFGDTTASGINDSQTGTNNGNVVEDFNIRGTNSAAWTLAATAGADQYTHSFCKTNCDAAPTWTALTTTNQSLATAVAVSGTQVFDLRIGMPTTSSSFVQQSVNVVIQATAN